MTCFTAANTNDNTSTASANSSATTPAVSAPANTTNMTPAASKTLPAPSAATSGDLWTVHLLVPSSEVGAVIGRRGASIKRIRETSGARVRVSDANAHPQLLASERVITLTGTADAILSSIQLVCQTIQDELSLSTAAAPHVTSNSSGNGGGEQQQQPPPPPQARPVNLKLVTDNSQIGCIIGRGGDTIRNIRATSGASIHVESDMIHASTSKRINVLGSADAVFKAIASMWARLRATPPRGLVVPFSAPANPNHPNPHHHPHQQQQQQQQQQHLAAAAAAVQQQFPRGQRQQQQRQQQQQQQQAHGVYNNMTLFGGQHPHQQLHLFPPQQLAAAAVAAANATHNMFVPPHLYQQARGDQKQQQQPQFYYEPQQQQQQQQQQPQVNSDAWGLNPGTSPSTGNP